jgi:hypothetical protein
LNSPNGFTVKFTINENESQYVFALYFKVAQYGYIPLTAPFTRSDFLELALPTPHISVFAWWA